MAAQRSPVTMAAAVSTAAAAAEDEEMIYEEYPRTRDVEATIRAIATINPRSEIWNDVYRTYSSILDFFAGVVNDIEKKNGRDVSRRYRHKVSKCRKTRDVLRKEKCASKTVVEFCKSVISSANSVFRLCIRKRWHTTVKHIRSSAPPCHHPLKKVVRRAAVQEGEAVSSGAVAAQEKPSLYKTTKGLGKKGPPYTPEPITTRTEKEKNLVYNPTPIRKRAEEVPTTPREASGKRKAEEEEGPNKKIRSQKEVAATRRREEVAVSEGLPDKKIKSHKKATASGNGITSEDIKTIVQEFLAISKKSLDWRSEMKETAKIAVRTADAGTPIVEKLEKSLAAYIVDFLANDISREAKRLLVKHYRGEENDPKAIDAECTWRANRVTASAADSVAKAAAAAARDEARTTTPSAAASTSREAAEKKRMPAPPPKTIIKKKKTTAVWKNHLVQSAAIDRLEKNQAIFKTMMHHVYNEKPRKEIQRWQRCDEVTDIPANSIDAGQDFDLKKPETDSEGVPAVRGGIASNRYPKKTVRDPATAFERYAVDLLFTCFVQKNDKKNLCKAFQTAVDGGNQQRSAKSARTYCLNNTHTAEFLKAAYENTVRHDHKSDKLKNLFHASIDLANAKTRATLNEVLYLGADPVLALARGCFKHVYNGSVMDENNCRMPLDIYLQLAAACKEGLLFCDWKMPNRQADNLATEVTGEQDDNLYLSKKYGQHLAKLGLEIWGKLKEGQKMVPYLMLNDTTEGSGNVLYPSLCYYEGERLMGAIKGEHCIPTMPRPGTGRQPFTSEIYYISSDEEEDGDAEPPTRDDDAEPVEREARQHYEQEEWDVVLEPSLGDACPPELDDEGQSLSSDAEAEDTQEEEQETDLPIKSLSPSFIKDLYQLYKRSHRQDKEKRIAKEQVEKKAMERQEETQRRQKEEKETRCQELHPQEEEEAKRHQKEWEEQAKRRDEEKVRRQEEEEETGLETPANNNEIDSIIYEHINGFPDEITDTEPLEANFPFMLPNQIQETQTSTNGLGLFTQQVENLEPPDNTIPGNDFLADLPNISEQGLPPTPSFTGHDPLISGTGKL